jgi:hypothetical protein
VILYTTMPQELIFPTEQDAYGKQTMITYKGIPLLVELTDGQSLQIVRVMSSDPQHFLTDACIPGSKISLANVDGLSAF